MIVTIAISAVAGAVAAVVSSKVYAYVKNKIVTPVEAKAATVEAIVKTDATAAVAEVKKAV